MFMKVSRTTMQCIDDKMKLQTSCKSRSFLRRSALAVRTGNSRKGVTGEFLKSEKTSLSGKTKIRGL